MKKINKKGFTIVELVIVIAVIAILAAVLIPTFSNIIRKAHISSDTQLIRNLNTALVTDKVSNGDHNTMFDALEATKASGYDVGKINASATDNEILWDSKNDVFCYFNNDKSSIEYIPETTRTFANPNDEDYWVISKTVNGKYSTYLYETELTTVENLTTGLDVGEESITSISYVNNTSNSKTVVIRTNGANTNLTIIAASDTVNHFGSVGSVDAQKIDMNCYNEYGKAAYVKVTEGKVVAKAGGTISVVFAANNDAEKVAVIKENQGTITTGLTVIQPVSDTNVARENGIALEYSIDGATAASMTNEQKTAAIATRETAVNTVAEAAVEANLIEEIEESGLYEARIGTTGYATFDEAASSILAGQTLVLLKDIVRVETVSVAVWDKPFNIDLNNHTYETLSDVDITLGNNGYKASAFCFAYDGNVEITIKNGTIKTKYGAPVYAASKTVILENVVLFQDHNNFAQSTKEYSSAVRSTGGAVIVNSGTFEGYYVLAASNSGGEYTINGGIFTGPLFFSTSTDNGVTKSFTINGGTFNEFEIINPNKGTVVITGGTFDADPTTYVSSGYHANNNGNGTWTVVAD